MCLMLGRLLRFWSNVDAEHGVWQGTVIAAQPRGHTLLYTPTVQTFIGGRREMIAYRDVEAIGLAPLR